MCCPVSIYCLLIYIAAIKAHGIDTTGQTPPIPLNLPNRM